MGITTTSALQLFRAATLGTIAFKAGRHAVPAHDNELMEMLSGRQVGETPVGEASTTALLSAWTASWHAANAANDEGPTALGCIAEVA